MRHTRERKRQNKMKTTEAPSHSTRSTRNKTRHANKSDEVVFDLETLQEIDRHTLQLLARRRGIRANQKSADIIEQLIKSYDGLSSCAEATKKSLSKRRQNRKRKAKKDSKRHQSNENDLKDDDDRDDDDDAEAEEGLLATVYDIDDESPDKWVCSKCDDGFDPRICLQTGKCFCVKCSKSHASKLICAKVVVLVCKISSDDVNTEDAKFESSTVLLTTSKVESIGKNNKFTFINESSQSIKEIRSMLQDLRCDVGSITLCQQYEEKISSLSSRTKKGASGKAKRGGSRRNMINQNLDGEGGGVGVETPESIQKRSARFLQMVQTGFLSRKNRYKRKEEDIKEYGHEEAQNMCFKAWKTFKEQQRKSDGKENEDDMELIDNIHEIDEKDGDKEIIGRGSAPRRSGIPVMCPGRCGLRNLGNTCYMNAVIQALSSSPAVRDFYIRRKEEMKKKQKQITKNRSKRGRVKKSGSAPASKLEQDDKDSLSECLTEILQSIWSGKRVIFTADDLLKLVWEKAPRFRGFKQQDAQEFLLFLLNECLIIHLVRGEISPTSFKLFKNQAHVSFPLEGLDMTNYLHEDEDHLHKKKKKEALMRQQHVPNLQQHEQQPLEMEGGEDDEEEDEERTEKFIYDLTGVVNHHGRGLNQGHFTSYGYNEQQETWFCFNDRKVTVASAEEVSRSQAYLLIYERRWSKIKQLGGGRCEASLIEQLEAASE
eukprot:jgi/Bigna1/127891/aug1.5_g2599